jgi:ferric-dicitrate binding protein FerR (iron transport regulator)
VSGSRDDELDPALERALEALVEERPDARFARLQRARFVGAGAVHLRRRRVLAALAAAAGVAVALSLWRGTRAPDAPAWRVLAARGPVTLDGAALDAATLARGGRLRTGPAGELRLVLGRSLALLVGPDSELDLPALAALGDDWRIGARSGHLALRTGPDFAGSRLSVRAPDAEVAVLGTRFAVDVFPEGTCVCCGEGRVDVRSLRDGAAAEVDPGGMAFAHAAGTITTGAVQPDHAPALAALEDAFE